MDDATTVCGKVQTEGDGSQRDGEETAQGDGGRTAEGRRKDGGRDG